MADMGQGGDRYTDRHTDRCTALYCGYTVHADAISSGMAARFACCDGYTAVVDAQIEQLSPARLHQMLLLYRLLWVLTPLGLQRATLRTVITGTAAPDAFAVRIVVGTNPFGT